MTIVDGLSLPAAYQELLCPCKPVTLPDGSVVALPRYFYVVESRTAAAETQLTPHFGVWEFMEVDLHEAALLRSYPRYLPCAITLLAAVLETVRTALGEPVRIAANGAYRSPAHRRSRPDSPHAWGTAANIYRIGSEYLDTEDRISRYSETVQRTVAGCWIRPSGNGPGYADDHLHVDLGHVTVVPPAHWLPER